MSEVPPAGLGRRLEPVFDALARHYGPQHWWPARHSFEMIAGALLVQNTAWTNAQRALDNLTAARALSVQGILDLDELTLQELVRPSGYYRQKAAKLRSFARHVRDEHGGELAALLSLPMGGLRRELLSIWGVGAETADAIILYAAQQPSFVVDGYTVRVLSRIGLIEGRTSRRLVRKWLMEAIAPDPRRYAEYHALVVRHGKAPCRKTPDCPECPLLAMCRYGGGVVLR